MLKTIILLWQTVTEISGWKLSVHRVFVFNVGMYAHNCTVLAAENAPPFTQVLLWYHNLDTNVTDNWALYTCNSRLHQCISWYNWWNVMEKGANVLWNRGLLSKLLQWHTKSGYSMLYIYWKKRFSSYQKYIVFYGC